MIAPTNPLSRSASASCRVVVVSMAGTVPRTRLQRVGDLPYLAPLTSSARDERHDIGVGAGAPRLALFQRVDCRHLIGAEREVEEAEVLLDPGGRRRLGEHDAGALDMPAQHDLGRGPSQLAGDRDDGGIVEDAALRDRLPRLGLDAVLLAVYEDVVVLEVR